MTDLEYGGRVSRPADVSRAFWLLISSVAISLFGGFAEYLKIPDNGSDAIAKAMRGAGISQILADAISNSATVASLVIIVLWNAFWVLLSFKIRAGRNWARITLTVLTTLGIAILLSGTSSFHFQQTSTTEPAVDSPSVTISLNNEVAPNTLVTEISWIISTALAVVAIVFIFRPAANAYVRRPR